MFINFSNHPKAKWSQAQLDGTIQFGEIIDIPFPTVEATADEEKIRLLAEQYVGKISSIAKQDDVIMVQGEFSLTYAVITRLNALGYKVVTACSERIVTEWKDETGETIKEARFKFKRYREYV